MRLAALVVTLATITLAAPAAARPVRGLVFDDLDGDGRPSAGEPGVAHATVAYDTLVFAETSEAGEFTLEVPDRGNRIIWVRVPDGFTPGPAWAYVPARDAPASHEAVEIALHRLARPARGPITFVFAADTHLSMAQPFANDLGAVATNVTALDPAPSFFTILGDVTQGNQAEQFDLADASLAGLGVPYVPVPGNHDWYDDGVMWFQRYGPDNYSFDLDHVHFVVWNMAMSSGDIERYLGAELARVRPDMTIVALTHAPPVPAILQTLRVLGVDYVLSGHTHTNRVVDHGGLFELTTEPLLMGGLDLVPAGYRVGTIDRSGVLSTYHRTVVEEPQLVVIAPAHGSCIAPAGGALVVAAELDAGTAAIEARVDCATPITLRFAGGWNWRADLPALEPGRHTLLVDARAPSGMRRAQLVGFDVCEPVPLATPTAAWPQLGGSARHTGSVAHPIAPPLALRWAATVGGNILHAAPVVADGSVFVSATDLGDGRGGGVVAIDLATGRTRWRVATTSPVRGSPAVAGDIVAVGQLDGTVLGLATQTGELRWRYELGAGLAPESASLFAAPTADAGDFLVGNQRHLAALAGDVGAAVWHVDPVPEGTYSQSLAAIAVGDNVAVGVFHRELGGLIAWDRATGSELWRAKGLVATAINASPVIGTDTVYVANGLTEVTALDLSTGAVRWTTKLDEVGFDWGNATVGTPALAANILVVPTLYRDVVALDARTGAELWRVAAVPGPLRTTHYRGAGEAAFEASPVITGDIVWIADTAGTLSAIELVTGRRRYELDLGTPVLAGLAVAGDWLVVASYDGSVRAFAPTHARRAPAKPPSCDVVVSAGCCDARPGASAPPWLALAMVYGWRWRRRRRRRPNASAKIHADPEALPTPHDPPLQA